MSRSAGNQALAELRGRITELETELAAERQRSAKHRADLERERARGDQLATEIAELRATLAALREEMTPRVRPWWRRWKRAG
jgi:primosomal protein N''